MTRPLTGGNIRPGPKSNPLKRQHYVRAETFPGSNRSKAADGFRHRYPHQLVYDMQRRVRPGETPYHEKWNRSHPCCAHLCRVNAVNGHRIRGTVSTASRDHCTIYHTGVTMMTHIHDPMDRQYQSDCEQFLATVRQSFSSTR